MSPFEYVQVIDVLAVIAVFFFVVNVGLLFGKLIQVHAMIVAKLPNFRLSASKNNWAIGISSCVIYWHLFIPSP